MGQGRRIRTVAPAAVLALVLGAGLVVSAPAQAATERADTLAQARNDTAIAAKQVVRERLHSAADQDWFRYAFTKKVRAVVTLGSLPANYNLAVYKADGTRVAASNHAGKGFERVYFTAAQGTYFVRVASTQGSSSKRYAIWLRPLTEPLSLQTSVVPAVNSGYPFVVAEFVNTTPNWLRVQQVSVVSYDAAGNVLKGDALALMQVRVAPYGLLHVASSTVTTLPPAYHHMRVSARGTVIDPVSLAGLTLKPGASTSEGGYTIHTGTVRNASAVTRGGDEDQTGPTVIMTYYNANGTVQGVSGANIRPAIAPGGTGTYRVRAAHSSYWYSPFPAVPNRVSTRLIAAW